MLQIVLDLLDITLLAAGELPEDRINRTDINIAAEAGYQPDSEDEDGNKYSVKHSAFSHSSAPLKSAHYH
ncbi:hypothetical protein D3C73_1309100 [compost metagenome]